MGLAINAHIRHWEELVAQQRKPILELSTQGIEHGEGISVAPLIGITDSLRARQVMERLLDSIVANQSMVAILDVTGLLSWIPTWPPTSSTWCRLKRCSVPP